MAATSKKTKTEEAEPEVTTTWLDAIEVPDPLPETLGERKCLVMAAIPTIPKLNVAKVKTKKGGEYSFRFVSHDQVAQIARPLLSMFGIDYSPTPDFREVGGRTFVTLVVALRKAGSREPDDNEVSEWSLPLPDGVTPQEMGAILSYLTKYALQKTFLMDAGEEDLDSSAFAGSTGGGLPDRKRDSKPKTESSNPPAEVALQSKKTHPLAFAIPDAVWPKIAGLWHDHGSVSEKQRARLYAIAGSNKWTAEEVKAVVEFHLGATVDGVPFGKPYDAVVATFEKFGPTRNAEAQLDGAVAEEEEPPADEGYPGPGVPEGEQDDIPF